MASLDPRPGQQVQRRRLELWVQVITIAVAIALLSYPLGIRLGKTLAERTGAGTLIGYLAFWVFLLLGVLGCLLLRRRGRAAAERRYHASLTVGRYRWSRSSAPWLVAGGWWWLIGALTLSAAGIELTGPPPTPPPADVSESTLTAVGIGAVVVLTLLSLHRSRRLLEIDPLIQAGLLERSESAPVAAVGWRGFGEGLHTFVVSACITMGFVLADWLQLRLDGEPRSGPDRVFDVAMAMIGYPTLICLVIVVVLALSPLRWVVRDSLRPPLNRVALALALGGILLAQLVDHWVVLAAAGIGMTLVAITMLQLMDRGPQPWLGLLVLVGGWVLGFLVGGSGQYSLQPPEGQIRWLAAIVGAVLLVVDVRGLWRLHLGVRHVADRGLPRSRGGLGALARRALGRLGLAR